KNSFRRRHRRALHPSERSVLKSAYTRTRSVAVVALCLLIAWLVDSNSPTRHNSEDQLHAQLQLPRAAQIAARRARRRNLPESRRRERVLRLREVRMVQQIERLRAELQ